MDELKDAAEARTAAAGSVRVPGPKPKQGRVTIVMNRSFEAFGDAERQEFLRDLSSVTGSTPDEIQTVGIYQGCVVYELKMPKPAVERLVEYFESTTRDDLSDEMRDLLEFFQKHYVTGVKDTFEVFVRVKSDDDPARSNHRTGLTRGLIFVHGWSGDQESFGDLPRFLASATSAKPLIYRYPTGWYTLKPKEYSALRFVARNFDNWVRNECDQDELAIVAHSMGGLIARRFLVDQALRRDALDRKFRQLTFVASPFDGVSLADLFKLLVRPNREQFADLAPRSEFLDDLNLNWKQWLRLHPELDGHVRSIYSPADLVVRPPSGYGTDDEPIAILGVGHREIVKPRSATDEIVTTIVRLLKAAGFAPPTGPTSSSVVSPVGV